MSLGIRLKSNYRMLALALVPAGILLATPAAQAHVGIGLNFGFPPVVAPPPVVVAPPPVVIAPPYYYTPPAYYYAPGYGYFWYDRFGHRHWRR